MYVYMYVCAGVLFFPVYFRISFIFVLQQWIKFEHIAAMYTTLFPVGFEICVSQDWK